MRELVSKLSRLAGQASASFGAFDPSPLLAGGSFELAPTVTEYFQTCIPDLRLDLECCSILAAADLIFEHHDLIPSCFCAPRGLISIARQNNGDSFSVDVRTGKVYLLSHEKYETNAIEPGWNSDLTGFLPALPVRRENIINTSGATGSTSRPSSRIC